MSDFASPDTKSVRAAIEALTCEKCGAFPMRAGKALAQTCVAGSPDFSGDKPSTFSVGGPGELIDCFKCPECGWSITS